MLPIQHTKTIFPLPLLCLKWMHSGNKNLCSSTAPQGWGTSPPCLSFPCSQAQRKVSFTSAAWHPPLCLLPLFPLLQPGDKSTASQARQTSVPKHILIFQPAPTLALLPPASSTVFMFHFPGNKRLVTMRRATAERLVKFVTHML